LGPGLLTVEVSRSHIIRHTHTRWDSSERVISSSQRPLPTKQTQETNVHSLSGIRSAIPAAARLRVCA